MIQLIKEKVESAMPPFRSLGEPEQMVFIITISAAILILEKLNQE